MKKQKKYIRKNKIRCIVYCICVFFLVGCGRKEPMLLEDLTEESSEESSEDSSEHETEVQDDQKNKEVVTFCYVHVCGAVLKPGVYQLPNKSRIYEAVMMAGGFREDACMDYLNQAQLVADGEQIRIPTDMEVKEHTAQPIQSGSEKVPEIGVQKNDSGLININTADENALCTLPGIGSLKAANIIAYREQNGAFSSIEDILQVEGIKNGTYNKLKDKITI